MQFFMRTCVRFLCLFAVCILMATTSRASHIFGMDLYYTHIAGNSYRVYLVVFGDCSGGAFGSLSSSAPVVGVYDGGSFLTNLTLSVQAPASGVEVTPVCPADAGNTSCVSTAFTLPGIKKFVYASTITLPYTSTVWRFLFQSNMGGSYVAGRSMGITNVNMPTSGSPIQLVDTLNNTIGANSNAVYTAIAAPFFCISAPANYNPGAVDPDGDHLVFSLVPGIDNSTGVSVNYIYPYNATNPISAASGTFSFSSVSGQLAFTPNIAQKALVVYNVRELTASGVLKGTSQRELTTVVLSPCTNNPPAGTLSGGMGGSITSPTQFSVCNSVDSFGFLINPTDADGDSLTVSVSGVPSGATFTVTNNGSTAPHCKFRWLGSSATPGTYTFYVTIQDNGCPLSSRQTIAYTITVLPSPNEVVTVISAATCTRRAILHITPTGSYSPFLITVLSGSTTVHSFSGVTGMITDSLTPGTYTIRIYNPVYCFKDTSITLAAPALPGPIITYTTPVCPGDSTGTITVTGTSGTTPYQYAIGAGAFSSSGTFTSLVYGSYTLHIKDANSCIKDTVFNLPDPPAILENIFIRKPTCDTYANGRVIIRAYNSVAPYTYAVGSGAYSASDTFNNLAAGTYTFHIKNANGCVDDTTLTLSDSLRLHGAITITPILCNGGNAVVTISGSSGYPAYSYALGSAGFGSTTVYNLPAGAYVFHVTDVQNCHFDTTVTLNQPTPVTITPTLYHVSCNGLSNGRIVVAASGGTPGYVYNVDGGSFISSATLTGLSAGTHIVGVEDANGCIYFDTVTITEPTPIAFDTIKMTMPTCYSGTNGVIRIYASGGTSGYLYAVNTGSYGTSATFSGLGAATYVLHIKDANGCIKDSTVTLAQPAAISPIAVVTPSLCSTLANGAVHLSATGGTPAYTYAIGAGGYSASGAFVSVPSGTFLFHIKDANGCIKDTVLTIIDSLHISGTFALTSPTCNGDTDGVISVTGTGGTMPYTYAFGAGSFGTTDTFVHLAGGVYVIFEKDSNGCIGSNTVTLTQPEVLRPALTLNPPSCYGFTDGSILLNATGGTPAYTFSLNGGLFLTTAAFVGLPTGTDTIGIKDAHGCRTDTVITLTQPAPLAVTNITGTNISCYNGADGTVTVTGTGGTTPYRYAANLSAYQLSNTLTGLGAGLQTIHFKDAHGCLVDTFYELTQPAPLVFPSATIISPTCEGYADGSVVLHAEGGTRAYQFSKDNINFSADSAQLHLTEGTYTFFVKDNHNCSADTTITLKGYPHIVIDSLHIKGVSCAGNTDGAITIFASGGNQPLHYSMSGLYGHPSPTVFDHLDLSEHTLTITDSTNCKKDSLFTLPEPDTFRVFAAATPNDCNGQDNGGAVSVSVTGGTEPYTYLWADDTANKPTITGKPNGSYFVLVHDVNDCKDSATAKIIYDDCCIPFIPSAFSPNGDGKNEEFRIRYKGDVRIIEFSVFNRFGERVYMTEYSEQGWDGTYKGIPADIGVYYYYVRLICGNLRNNVLEFKGDVTLIR